MGERRRSERQRSLLKGRINFNNGRSTLDCLVRDISEHGARLKVSGAFVLPKLVELYMPSKNARIKGKIAWRTSDEIGLEFGLDDVLARKETPDDLAGRVRCVESQVAILERNVAELRAILCTGQGSEKQERDARRPRLVLTKHSDEGNTEPVAMQAAPPIAPTSTAQDEHDDAQTQG